MIKQLLGRAHIGVTAGVYAHVRLRLQRQAIETLGTALGPTNDDPLKMNEETSVSRATLRTRVLIRCHADARRR